MFIPYHTSNGGQINGNSGNQNLNMLQASTRPTLYPNMSGNIGFHDNFQQGSEFYNTLSENAMLDPLWSQKGDCDSNFESNTKVIERGRCLHCKHWVGDKGADLVQIQHVLNGCKSFKMQGRYHWRHEAVLDYIGTLLEKKTGTGGSDSDSDFQKDWTAFRCYIDVQGRRTHDDGTVPDQLLITSAKPDIFILDQRDHLTRPEVIIIDLTIPWDGRVDAARSEKLAKFSNLVAAIKANDAFNVTYQSFEIGSFRQRLSDGSESAMKLLYNYISAPKMTFDAFRCNLIDLVNYSSYHIFSSRNETKWDFATIYPIPQMPDNSTTEEPTEEPIYENVSSVTELVEEMSKSTDDFEELSKSTENEFEIRAVDEQIEEIKVQNTTEKTTMATLTAKTTTKLEAKNSVEIFSSNVIRTTTTPLKSSSGTAATEDIKTTMSIYQLLAILLIFCLILLGLNIMWNNLFTTLLICCITLPILRWLGKV